MDAKGLGGYHTTAQVDADERELEVPVVGVDYAFMTQQEADTIPILAVRDSLYKYVAASCVPNKGGSPYAVKYLSGVLRDLGYRKLVLKSDNEPSILLLKDQVKENCKEIEIIYQEVPVGDHAANGMIENAIKVLKGQIRAARLSSEKKLGKRISGSSDRACRGWLTIACQELLI